MTNTDGLSDLHEEIKVLEKWVNQSLGEKKAIPVVSIATLSSNIDLSRKKIAPKPAKAQK